MLDEEDSINYELDIRSRLLELTHDIINAMTGASKYSHI